MKKLRLLILDDYVEDVLVALQHLGYVHIVDVREREAKWEKLLETYDALEEVKYWNTKISEIEQILERLDKRKDLGLLEQLFRPEEQRLVEIGVDEEKELTSNVEGLIEKIEKDIEANISRYRLFRNFLMELPEDEISIEDFRSTKRLYIAVGQIRLENVPLIEQDLERKVPTSAFYSHGRGRKRLIVVASPKLFEEEVGNILEVRGFQRIEVPEELTGSPTKCLEFIDSRMNEVDERNKNLILKLHDVVSCKIERLQHMEKLGKTKRIFVLEGWIPEAHAVEIGEIVTEASNGYAQISIVNPDEPKKDIPTLLKDRKIISSFNVLTEMYGTPRYDEIDPTPFFAFFFTFFVGLMLGDISLGMILTIGGFLVIRGAGSRSGSMTSLGRILVLSGISAIMFGVLTGQFMGGVLKTFSNGEISMKVFWINPADEPISFLFTVLIIGLFHILVGLALGVANNYMNGRMRDIVGDQISMVLMIIGAAIIVFTGQYSFEGYGILGYLTLLGGLTALILGKGLMGLLEITRIISNVISYVRILALNMASTWMGRIFVLLASMLMTVPYFGVIASIILLVLSQFFLIFISSFSTFAHSLRLHYVEFFGRFFNGGGTKFSPLQDKREYTKVNVGSDVNG